MAINIQNIEWNVHEYIISKFDINVNGKITNLSDIQIGKIMIEKDFDKDFLPIFLVELYISPKLYYNICKNNKNTTFTIVMQSQINNNGTVEKTSKYLDDVFIPLSIDGTPFVDENTFDTSRETGYSGDGSVVPEDLTNSYTFILGKKNNRNVVNHVYNTVLSSANMLNAIGCLLTSAGATNVLMSNVDNNTSYNELVLLPVSLAHQLTYLSSFYGLYKEGSQIFLDFNTFYILRNCAKCTAYRRNEIKTVTFYVYDSSNGNNINQGSVSDILTSSGYIALSSDGFEIKDETNSSGQYIGLNSIIINSDGTIDKVTNNTSSATNVITTSTHNKYFKDEVKLRLKELTGVVYINCSNIDLTLLTPNKLFKILSSSSKVASDINASYRLSSIRTVFIKEGNHYRDISEIRLLKSEG